MRLGGVLSSSSLSLVSVLESAAALSAPAMHAGTAVAVRHRVSCLFRAV
jgi:hypothetical protein